MEHAKQPRTLTNISEQTTKSMADDFFTSLKNPTTRGLHLLGTESTEHVPPIPKIAPQKHEVAKDVKGWYAGCVTYANLIDPGVELPPVNEVIDLIWMQYPEKGKIAA